MDSSLEKIAVVSDQKVQGETTPNLPHSIATNVTLELNPEKNQHLKKAATETPAPTFKNTVFITVLAALLFVALTWAADCRCLGRVSDSLWDVQDKTVDMLAKLEYLRYGPSIPSTDTMPVRLIELDDATIEQYSKGMYVFHRGSLAKLLNAVGADKPAAVFIDMDLTRPTGEAGAWSPGDNILLHTLNTPRNYPLLINTTTTLKNTRVLGLAAETFLQNHTSICFVSPTAIRDADFLVRRIARRTNFNAPFPAAEALFEISKKPNAGCPNTTIQKTSSTKPNGDVYGGVSNRMIFREPELWPGFAKISASDVLTGATSGLFSNALVLVGRTDKESFDEHLTPVGRFPGIFVHVNELMTLLSFGHKVQPITPLLGAPLAIIIMLLALLLTPILTKIITGWLEKRLKIEVKRDNVFERPFIWVSLFAIGSFMLHRYGLFMDYAFPILGLELARQIYQLKLQDLGTRLLKWGLRR